jgi:hypothetical protein
MRPREMGDSLIGCECVEEKWYAGKTCPFNAGIGMIAWVSAFKAVI